ncbi:MAG: hypothetical protein LC792_18670 [Actinobacteria bacterium]|nr:hypothetical protein [Actinomycetota bacterium]
MTNIEQVFLSIKSAKTRFAPRHRKIEQVLAIREGRWNEVAPGLFPEDIPEPMIANFIDVAATSAAESIAPLPSVTCSNPNMATDSARKAADKRTKIAQHYVQHSALGDWQAMAGDHIDSYGFTAYSVHPDFEAKTSCIYVESAIGAYYLLDRKGKTVWYARCFRRNTDELMYEFAEFGEVFRDYISRGVTTVEVIQYYGADEDLLLVSEGSIVLARIPNPLKRCRVRVVEKPKTHELPRGSYDDVVWVQMARAKFGALTMRIAQDVADAPTVVPKDLQELEIGPGAVIQTDTPNLVRKVDMSVPSQPFAELQNLQQEMRTGARFSEVREGNTDASIITGKGIQALNAGPDLHIKTLQGRLAAGLSDALEMCFELDELLWPNLEKSVNGLQDGAPFELKYKPSRDIAGNYKVSVSYGLTAGLDPNRALVYLLQLQTSGDISRDTVMRQLPFDIDVTAEQKKIDVERARDALSMSMASLPQAIPMMATQGGDPTEIIMKVSLYVQALQKGDSPEDAAAKAFPPPPPPEAAPEAPAGVPGAPPGAEGAPQDPLAALAGGGGGAPPESGAPNDLLMALAGTGPTGNPNLSFAVSKRRPV